MLALRYSLALLLVAGVANAQAPAPAPVAPAPVAPAPVAPAPVAEQPVAPAPVAEEPDDSRRPGELDLLLGFGNAVCDNEQPDSDCPVDGGFAFGLGGDWRFHPHFAVGLELAGWAFSVRDAWRGQLQNDATDVKFNSYYIAPFARWYWFDHGTIDPYLQAGFGYGAVTAEASNDTGNYKYAARGIAYLFGIGVEWKISRLFRLGPQFLAYLHVSSKICEESNGGGESCRSPGKNPNNGDREGLALPYRLVAVGTFTLGNP